MKFTDQILFDLTDIDNETFKIQGKRRNRIHGCSAVGLLQVCGILVELGTNFEHHKCLADDSMAHAKKYELCEAGNFENCAKKCSK